MKLSQYGKVFLAGLGLALLLAACSGPQGEVGPQEIVVTEGIPAPKAAGAPVRPQGNLVGELASAVGSQTTPLSVDGCANGSPSTVEVTYRIQTRPRQDFPAGFTVDTSWTYDATTGTWSGSNPVTVTFQESEANQTKRLTLTVRNGSAPASGTSSFEVNPFNPYPSRGEGKLNITGNSKVTVNVTFTDCPAPPANTPPTLAVPNYVLAEATGPDGAHVNFVVTATDAEDGDLTGSVVCTPPSGSLFPIGETRVTCTVTDSGGLSASASFPVYVEDSTPPVFSGVPTGPVTRIAQNRNGWALSLSDLGITAADPGNVSPPVTITCDPPEGTYLAIGGTYTITCTAQDSATYRAPVSLAPAPPNKSTITFTVSVTLDVDPTGFLPPLRMMAPYSSHKRGSTVPHKFYPPRYADGSPATDLAEGLRLVLVRTTNCAADTSETYEGNEFATGSTAWRYDPDSGQYIFNLKTQTAWTTGCYRTTVSYAGIKLAETYFNLVR
jgi:hypothetical protein